MRAWSPISVSSASKSPPAQNAFRPAPRRTTTRTPGDSSDSPARLPSSAHIAGVSAFRLCSLSIKSVAIDPSTEWTTRPLTEHCRQSCE